MAASAEAEARVYAADDELLGADVEYGFRCLHVARMIETAATHVCDGDRTKGNQFLRMIALGGEATWSRGEWHARAPASARANTRRAHALH
jgi:hypothetical protein